MYALRNPKLQIGRLHLNMSYPSKEGGVQMWCFLPVTIFSYSNSSKRFEQIWQLSIKLMLTLVI